MIDICIFQVFATKKSVEILVTKTETPRLVQLKKGRDKGEDCKAYHIETDATHGATSVQTFKNPTLSESPNLGLDPDLARPTMSGLRPGR